LEELSDASFLGQLLVLPANVILVWKGIARYKHSSLFGLVISNEEKKSFIILTPGHRSVLTLPPISWGLPAWEISWKLIDPTQTTLRFEGIF
jgi:hypothetical protein